MNEYDLYNRCKAIARSCQTPAQYRTAANYIDLAARQSHKLKAELYGLQLRCILNTTPCLAPPETNWK